MAWHGILYFLKSLRSLEVFRKNPHVKIPPKSPSTNFLVNSKFQFLIQKFFFLAFGPADLAAHLAFGPAGSRWPLSSPGPNPTLLAQLARVLMVHLWKYVFPFGSRLPEPATSPSSL
jgi:hypothetical protein